MEVFIIVTVLWIFSVCLHEFGHALHGLLSSVTYPSISGTSVATDFVELPSQLYEHWLEQPDVLRRFAKHYQTGAPIPEDLLRRLIAAGLVPERAGAAVNVLAYVPLADLMLIEGSSALLEEWTRNLRARWAGHRAAAAAAGGHQGLWLDGKAAQAIACGAPVTPVVVGNVNPAAFGDLIRLCAQLEELLHGPADSQPDEDQPDPDQPDVNGAADAPA